MSMLEFQCARFDHSTIRIKTDYKRCINNPTLFKHLKCMTIRETIQRQNFNYKLLKPIEQLSISETEKLQNEFGKTNASVVLIPNQLAAFDKLKSLCVNDNPFVANVLMLLQFAPCIKNLEIYNVPVDFSMFTVQQLKKMVAQLDRLVFSNCLFDTVSELLQIKDVCAIQVLDCVVKDVSFEEMQQAKIYCNENGNEWSMKVESEFDL